MSIVEAAIEASKLRLRPILMTTLALVGGMLPLAVGKATRLHPFSKDPDPSPIGLHMLSDEVARHIFVSVPA